MSTIVLQPAREDSLASMVALVGALDIAHAAGHADVSGHWALISEPDAHVPEYRPALTADNLDEQRFAELVAAEPGIDRTRFPSEGRGQSLMRLLEKTHPGVHPQQVIDSVCADLEAQGCEREALLVRACVAYHEDTQYARGPLTGSTKSDLAQAANRLTRPLLVDDVLREIGAVTWEFDVEPAGNWGLAGEVFGTGAGGSRVLSRLLLRGILVTAWRQTWRRTWGGGRMPRTPLFWPIWNYPLPYHAIVDWLAWPALVVSEDGTPLATFPYGSDSRWDTTWFYARSKPVNEFLRTYPLGVRALTKDIPRYKRWEQTRFDDDDY